MMRMIRFRDLEGRRVVVAPQIVATVAECAADKCEECDKHGTHWYVATLNSQAWGITAKMARSIVRQRDRCYNEGDEWQCK